MTELHPKLREAIDYAVENTSYGTMWVPHEMRLLRGEAARLGFRCTTQASDMGFTADLFSGAIECAEALGL